MNSSSLGVLVMYVSFLANALDLDGTESYVQTKTSTVGENVQLDCNISQDTSQALWRRETSNVNQLLFVGLHQVRSKDADNIEISSTNYSLFMNLVSVHDEGLYTCKQNDQTMATYCLNINVTSELRIQHEGQNITESVSAEKGSELKIYCVVFRAKEKPVITWRDKDTYLKENTKETKKSSNQFVEGTFDFRKPLTYIVRGNTKLLCSSFEDSNKSVSIMIFTSSNNSKASSLNFAALLVMFCLTFLSSLLCCGLVYHKWYRGSHSTFTIRTPKHDKRLRPSNSIGLDMKPRITPTRSKIIHGQSSRILPDVPNEKHSYAQKINEEDYYSAVTYNLPSPKVFIRKRLCLVSKLSDGVICERWFGYVKSADGEKKCVLISRLKDVIRYKDLSWDALVKRLVEMPESAHIFKVLGMCFDKTHLLLVQDNMTCESLVEYLTLTTYGTEAWTNDMNLHVQTLTKISMQVGNGMEFAMKYGLSHPGLSIKNILINEDNVCKLYDFCLTEDATKVVKCLKSEPNFSPSRHPRECVERSEYTCASDVWYTAFTVLEIYYYGSKQFRNDSTGEISEVSSSRPELCPTTVYGLVKKCMTPNHNDRVKSVKELLTVLKEEIGFTSEEICLAAQIKKNDMEKYSSYVPVLNNYRDRNYIFPIKL